MRQLVAALGLVWAVANLYAGILLLLNGLAAKTLTKGFVDQALLVLGGFSIGLFAVLLAWQCMALARMKNSE